MALEPECIKLLLKASKKGVNFDSCLTIGRQVMLVSSKELKLISKNNGLLKDYAFSFHQSKRRLIYSEDFFKVLGAKTVKVLDASNYEGASIIHDLNIPLNKKHEQFDVVFDGGSLEHIFNIPVVLSNYMSFVKIGGRFIAHIPINNHVGHGFYQFSPEFFFRVFSPQNGFVVEKAIAIEYGPVKRLFEAKDPQVVKATTHIINKYPLYLYIQAKKIKEITPFKKWPQQYIYDSIWSGKNEMENSSKFKLFGARIKQKILNIAPTIGRYIDALYHSSLNSNYSLSNKKLFTKIK